MDAAKLLAAMFQTGPQAAIRATTAPYPMAQAPYVQAPTGLDDLAQAASPDLATRAQRSAFNAGQADIERRSTLNPFPLLAHDAGELTGIPSVYRGGVAIHDAFADPALAGKPLSAMWQAGGGIAEAGMGALPWAHGALGALGEAAASRVLADRAAITDPHTPADLPGFHPQEPGPDNFSFRQMPTWDRAAFDPAKRDSSDLLAISRGDFGDVPPLPRPGEMGSGLFGEKPASRMAGLQPSDHFWDAPRASGPLDQLPLTRQLQGWINRQETGGRLALDRGKRTNASMVPIGLGALGAAGAFRLGGEPLVDFLRQNIADQQQGATEDRWQEYQQADLDAMRAQIARGQSIAPPEFKYQQHAARSRAVLQKYGLAH